MFKNAAPSLNSTKKMLSQVKTPPKISFISIYLMKRTNKCKVISVLGWTS